MCSCRECNLSLSSKAPWKCVYLKGLYVCVYFKYLCRWTELFGHLKAIPWKGPFGNRFSCGFMVTFPWIGDILQVTELIQMYTNETLTMAQFYFLTKSRSRFKAQFIKEGEKKKTYAGVRWFLTLAQLILGPLQVGSCLVGKKKKKTAWDVEKMFRMLQCSCGIWAHVTVQR